MGKKVYAVRKGRQTGIFDSWPECQKQIMGFSGAEYKSFPSREEAKHFIEGVVKEKKQTFQNGIPKEQDNWKEYLSQKDTAVAYVDGSFDKVSGNFSYGMVFLYQNQETKHCKMIYDAELAQMRNVAGEIKGSEAAMRYAIKNKIPKLVIFHDYEGIAKWCNGAWKANKEGTKAYRDFYESIADKIEITFVKVKGHSNDKYNDMADELAKQALGIGSVYHEIEEE